jgi:O-antigen/teichoic acid export membrane protein
MANAGRLLRNFVVMLAGNVLGQFLFFVGLAYLARVLGPSDFGIWNFAQIWMLYLLRMGEFGLEVIGIRGSARDPQTVPAWIATIVSTRLGLAVILFGIAVAAVSANLLPAGTSSLVLISALAVFPMALLLEWVFESRQEVGLISGARILKGLLFLAGITLFVRGSGDTELAAALYVIGLSVPGLALFVVVVRRFGFDGRSVRLRTCVDALRTSAPIGIATLLSQYSLSVSTIVIAYVLSKEDLGYYTAAYRIVLFLWAYVITSMHRILLPSLSRSFHESMPAFQRFMERFFRLAALAAVPLGLVGTLCSGWLMTLLYSSRYEASGVVFGFVVWGFVLAMVRSILEIGLIASDRQRRYVGGMLVMSLAYTIFTPILTWKMGMTGTAIAVVAAELSYFVYLIVSSPYIATTILLKSMWRPVVAAIAAAVAVYPAAGLHPVLRSGAGFVVFLVVIVILKGITQEDVDLARTLLQRRASA